MQAQPRRRHEHLGGVDADAEIAGQRQIGRTAIDAAVEPADGRHGEIFQPVDDDLERRSRRSAPGALAARSAIEPRSYPAEKARPVPVSTSTRIAAIGLDPVEQFQQRLEIVRLQPVQMLRPVEADGGAGAVDIEQRRARGIRGNGGMVLHYLFSSARRWASASMVSARSGCRAISRRKSTRSSTNSRDTRVVVMLAERDCCRAAPFRRRRRLRRAEPSCRANPPRPRRRR